MRGHNFWKMSVHKRQRQWNFQEWLSWICSASHERGAVGQGGQKQRERKVKWIDKFIGNQHGTQIWGSRLKWKIHELISTEGKNKTIKSGRGWLAHKARILLMWFLTSKQPLKKLSFHLIFMEKMLFLSCLCKTIFNEDWLLKSKFHYLSLFSQWALSDVPALHNVIAQKISHKFGEFTSSFLLLPLYTITNLPIHT